MEGEKFDLTLLWDRIALLTLDCWDGLEYCKGEVNKTLPTTVRYVMPPFDI